MNLETRITKIEQSVIPEEFYPPGWEKNTGTMILIEPDETQEQAVVRWEKEHGRTLNILYAKNGLPNVIFIKIVK